MSAENTIAQNMEFVRTIYAPWLRQLAGAEGPNREVADNFLLSFEDFEGKVRLLEAAMEPRALMQATRAELERIRRLTSLADAALDRDSDAARALAEAASIAERIMQPAPAGNVVAFRPRGGSAS